MSENNPLSPKEKEELLNLKVQRQALKMKTYFEIIKSGLLIIGAIVIFYVIQKPASTTKPLKKPSLEKGPS